MYTCNTTRAFYDCYRHTVHVAVGEVERTRERRKELGSIHVSIHMRMMRGCEGHGEPEKTREERLRTLKYSAMPFTMEVLPEPRGPCMMTAFSLSTCKVMQTDTHTTQWRNTHKRHREGTHKTQ